MRWIEIDLTMPHEEETFRERLETVRDRQLELPRLQDDCGLDSPLIVRFMAEQGQRLFRVLQGHVPESLTLEGDDPVGFHLHVKASDLTLPWNLLHDGLRFLLERAAICASTRPLIPETIPGDQPWLARHHETRFTDEALGTSSPDATARRYRPIECADPEVLFLSTGGNASVQIHARQERHIIDSALATSCGGIRLAGLDSEANVLTPAELVRRSSCYPAFHYFASTRWPQPVGEAPENGFGRWADIPETGSSLEVLGVDPIDVLLDEVVSRRADAAVSGAFSSTATLVEPAWQFEDGHLRPEDLARSGVMPALVFSNSYLSLEALGHRFLDSGASTFLGTQAVISTDDARTYSGDFYHAMALGMNAAAAQRQAALEAKQRHGADHPLWLSYGLVGAGELALQYL